MTYDKKSCNSENDYLRARFTMWLNTTLIRARARYIKTHTQKIDMIPLNAELAESIADPIDYFHDVERNKNEFYFAEEKIARAFANLSLMRQEVLRLIFVEEKTTEEIAQLLCISPNCVYQFKHQALTKLKHSLEEEASANEQ